MVRRGVCSGMGEFSVREALRSKNVLLTGASGFLGKVWLCMLLVRVPEIGKIYVLLRPKPGKTAKQRLEAIVNRSPVFSILHENGSGEVQSNLAEKLIAVEGDVSQADFGIDPSQLRRLTGGVDLIVNSAGVVNFAPDLRDAFHSNVEGPMHGIQLARRLGARFLHVSTAYVCGSRDGKIEERLDPEMSPSGDAFDAEQEYRELSSLVASQAECDWVEIGKARAKRWGWPNAYTYTKSLAESLIALRSVDVPYCLIRPSIVESAIRFPFPGWNEGVTTCAPLSYLACNWVRVFQMKPNYSLDLIPVDTVCEAMTVAAAQLLAGQSESVYHCASSDLNPLSQRFAMEMMNLSHREYFRSHGKGLFETLYLARSQPTLVDENSFFSAGNFKKLTGIALELADLLAPHLPGFAKPGVEFGKRALKKAKYEFLKAEHILETYRPFLQYDYVFKTENLRKHAIHEPEFRFQPEKIFWSEYIVKIHEPGLRKWCFPLLKGEAVEEYRPEKPWVLCDSGDDVDFVGGETATIQERGGVTWLKTNRN